MDIFFNRFKGCSIVIFSRTKANLVSNSTKFLLVTILISVFNFNFGYADIDLSQFIPFKTQLNNQIVEVDTDYSFTTLQKKVPYIPLLDEYCKTLNINYEIINGELHIETYDNEDVYNFIRHFDDVCYSNVNYDGVRKNAFFVNGEIVKTEKYLPVVIWDDIPYIPATEKFIVDCLGYNLEYDNGIVKISHPNADTDFVKPINYEFETNKGRYVGTINDKREMHGYGTFYYRTGKISYGYWENGELINELDNPEIFKADLQKLLSTDSEDFKIERNTYWKERVWDINPFIEKMLSDSEYDSTQVSNIKKKLSDYNNLRKEYYDGLVDKKSYWITGEIIDANDEYIWVLGEADSKCNGSENFKDEKLKIRKPSNGIVYMNEYIGLQDFVKSEIIQNKQIRIFKEKSIPDSSKKSMKNMDIIYNSLFNETSTSSYSELHRTPSFVNQSMNGISTFYNLNGNYTVEFLGKVDYSSIEKSGNYSATIDLTDTTVQVVDKFYNSKESFESAIKFKLIDNALDNKNYISGRTIERRKELIDFNNGIMDAYIIYDPKNENYFTIHLLVPEKMLDITINVTGENSFNDKYLEAVKVVKSIVMYE